VIPLGFCALMKATQGLQAQHIWTAIVLGHVTRCSLSIARFRLQRWRTITVELTQ
jgi:Na+-driven multidrug efflux pump